MMKIKKKIMAGLVSGLFMGIIVFGFWNLAKAQEDVDVDPVKLLDQALISFQHFQADKQMDWLHQNLKTAKGILLVPNLIKVGFFLGGAGGEAVLIARDEKTGEWSEPVFYTLGHVSFGLQLGGEKQEVLMLVRTERALTSMQAMDFKLGGDTSMAIGPIGGGFSGSVKTDIVSFSYSKGVFAGVAFEGAILKFNSKANKKYYGREVNSKDILVLKTIRQPLSEKLQEALRKASQ
ncbi:MAG: hypothetical protein C0407_06120 [Desulfobacca sp.]|nr:hypothetical protein [Desulfobacca sp.]